MKKTKKSTGVSLFYGPPADEAAIRYYAGFFAPDPFILLRRAGKNHLVVNTLEEGRAVRTAKNAEIWTARRLSFSEKEAIRPAELILALARALRVRSVQVTEAFPASLADPLRAAGLRVETGEAASAAAREKKTREEVRQLEQAQNATARAMRRALAILKAAGIHKDGRLMWGKKVLTAERLRAEIEQSLMKQDYACEGTIVACGPAGADPHERGCGPLRAGEFIVLDIFPRHRDTGYWGDMTRTIIKGRGSAEQRRRFKAVCRAQTLALQKIRAGVSGAAIHRAVFQSLERDGFPRQRVEGREEGFIHGTGHGVGLQIHEAPRLSPRAGRLRAGHVVTVEPGLYALPLGGVRMEDLVVVTKDGCRKLATAPMRLEIS